jgi:hypothetical protein
MAESYGRNGILSAAFFLSLLTSFAIGVNFYYFLAIPLGLSLVGILAVVFRHNDRLSSELLLYSALAYLVLSFLWPRYVAFWIPGLPSLNLQRIANVVVLFAMVSSVLSSRQFRSELVSSFTSFRLFWACFFIFELFRFVSIALSERFFASLYQFSNEFFVHAAFVFLGVYFGSNWKIFKLFVVAVLGSFVVVFFIAIAEYIYGGNLFSGFVDPSNSYVLWALSDKIRGGAYRVQSTFGHPLTFAEFSSVALCISLTYFGFSRRAGWFKVFIAGLLITIGVASVFLTRSRAGYVAAAVSCTLIFVGPLLVGILRRRISLAAASFWSFSIGFVFIAAVVVGFVVFDYAFGSKSYELSNSARLLMFTRGIDLLVESPVVGHGVGMAAEVIGIRAYNGVSQYTVDSLLVSYAVESGLFAIVAFIGCFLSAISSCFVSLVRSNDREWFIWYGVIIAILSFFIFKIILSLIDNSFFMFILMGVSVSSLAYGSRSRVAPLSVD